MLQHAGGQLSPQQGAARGLLTESGKFVPFSLETIAVLVTQSTEANLLPRLMTSVLLQELFGAVQVSPLSSGYSLGSSNWIIQSHHEKVSYVSGSSLLTTHPQVGQLNIAGHYSDDLRDDLVIFFSQWTKVP